MSEAEINRLDGRTALVTGGGQGIGRAVAHALAGAGARVAVADINPETAPRVAEEIAAAGGEAIASITDVADADSVAEGIAQVEAELGRISILVNNAGGMPTGATSIESPDEDWDAVLGLNLRGVINNSRALWPSLVAGGGGVILNASSQASSRPQAGLAAYVTSKAAVAMLTKCMAIEGAPHGIRANSVHPGWILTPAMDDWLSTQEDPQAAQDGIAAADIPMGRMAHPDEIARVYLFLATDAGGYMTGAEVAVDGGSVLNP